MSPKWENLARKREENSWQNNTMDIITEVRKLKRLTPKKDYDTKTKLLLKLLYVLESRFNKDKYSSFKKNDSSDSELASEKK